jgi:tetratricopeptide (TPR) repeat protein
MGMVTGLTKARNNQPIKFRNNYCYFACSCFAASMMILMGPSNGKAENGHQPASKTQIVIPIHARGKMYIEESSIARTYTYSDFDQFKLIQKDFEKSNDFVRQASAPTSNETEALELLQKAIKAFPKNTMAYSNQADIYVKRKQYKEALTSLNKGIDVAPDDVNLYAKRANVLCSIGNFRDAIANINAVIKSYPTSANFYLRADIKEKMHDKAAAAEDIRLAIIASEQDGDDAMDEVDRLEALTAKKVVRPTLDTTTSESFFKNIVTLVKSNQRYDPVFIEKQLGIKLYEIPIKGKPSTHTNEFDLIDEPQDTAKLSEVKLHTRQAIEGPYVTIAFNTRHYFITYKQVEAAFGKPQVTDDDPPGEAIYKLPWGFLSFEFHRHGFKLLKRISISEINHRFEYLKSAHHQTSASGARNRY